MSTHSQKKNSTTRIVVLDFGMGQLSNNHDIGPKTIVNREFVGDSLFNHALRAWVAKSTLGASSLR